MEDAHQTFHILCTCIASIKAVKATKAIVAGKPWLLHSSTIHSMPPGDTDTEKTCHSARTQASDHAPPQ
jgi:hypothetical protein